MSLFTGLVDDAAPFPPRSASIEQAVAEHRDHHAAWYGSVIGPLVVPDTALAAAGRAVVDQGGDEIAVSVVTAGGAGGLTALARRADQGVAGVRIVAAESALRDLDDLVGSAGRVVAAAGELEADVSVYVEVPFVPGWVRAVEQIEAAGLYGKIRTGGTNPDAYPSAAQLAEQLSVLVEADLSFKATAGLHHAWPNTVHNDRGEDLPQHGFLTVIMALDALIDGSDLAEAEALLRVSDREQIAAAIGGWDEGSARRVRRRLRSFGCCGVSEPVADLVALGLLSEPA